MVMNSMYENRCVSVILIVWFSENNFFLKVSPEFSRCSATNEQSRIDSHAYASPAPSSSDHAHSTRPHVNSWRQSIMSSTYFDVIVIVTTAKWVDNGVIVNVIVITMVWNAAVEVVTKEPRTDWGIWGTDGVREYVAIWAVPSTPRQFKRMPIFYYGRNK